jgi:hypothetical protein
LPSLDIVAVVPTALPEPQAPSIIKTADPIASFFIIDPFTTVDIFTDLTLFRVLFQGPL